MFPTPGTWKEQVKKGSGFGRIVGLNDSLRTQVTLK